MLASDDESDSESLESESLDELSFFFFFTVRVLTFFLLHPFLCFPFLFSLAVRIVITRLPASFLFLFLLSFFLLTLI